MSAQILYCGHSACIITTESGKKIAIDPFLVGNPTCPPALQDPGKLDAIVLTHGHSDHVGSTIELAKKHRATVFATFELGVLLAKDGVPENQIQMMNKGGTVVHPNGIKVTLTNAYHSNSYDAHDGHTYYAGEACGAIIHLESGRTIYHAGDTCLFGDMALIGQTYKPEVTLLPIGDRFTMGPQEAARAAQLIRARTAIPIHHSTFGLLSGKPEEFKKALAGTEITAVVLEPGKAFEM